MEKGIPFDHLSSLTHSLTDWLTDCCLVNLMWPWRVKMPTQNLLRLLLLLMPPPQPDPQDSHDPLGPPNPPNCIWLTFELVVFRALQSCDRQCDWHWYRQETEALHWELFSDLVTQLTIQDKLRNLNNESWGLVIDNQRVTWGAFAILAMFPTTKCTVHNCNENS